MKAFFKLIRFPSLIIISLTMYMLRYFVLKPLLRVGNFELQLGDFTFACLVLSVVFMSAAVYSINNYFDVKLDRINNKKNVVGTIISRRQTMFIHTLLNIMSLVLAFYVSYSINHWQFVFIFVLISGVLWFHSTTYKYSFLIGSFIIAGVVSLIPIMIAVYEIPVLNSVYHDILVSQGLDFMRLFRWMLVFSGFSFIGMLIGLFLRDMKSIQGDKEIKRRSLPIVVGLKYTKLIIICLSTILTGASIFLWYNYLNAPIDRITPFYLLFFLVIPLSVLSISIFRSKEGDKLYLASMCFRIVMLAGISYSLVINYIMTTYS